MLKNRACANDTGVSRRAFMVAAPAAALVPAASISAYAIETPSESPALMELAAKLPEVERAYHDAVSAWDAAWAKWSPQWPLAPEACCNKFGGFLSGREIERDLSGRGLTREGEEEPWRIKTAKEMERTIEDEREALAKDDKRKRSYGKRFRQYRHDNIAEAELGLALLPGYLAEIERIKRESNFEEINKARYEASDALVAFVRNVLSEPSAGMEGVRIKAEAAAALGRMRQYDLKWASVKDKAEHATELAALLGQSLIDAEVTA